MMVTPTRTAAHAQPPKGGLRARPGAVSARTQQCRLRACAPGEA